MILGLRIDQLLSLKSRSLKHFKRVFNSRKQQQVQQQEQREKDLQIVAKYWVDSFIKAKTIHDILQIHEWMSKMESTIQQAQNLQSDAGPSKPPPTAEIHDSIDGTAVEINLGPVFGLDNFDLEDVQQPLNYEEFLMVFADEESSGSQHSTSKPKAKKMKKLAVSRKEFLSLQSKVDQILAAVTINQPHHPDVAEPQSLAERLERLETRERMTAERLSLEVEMGIRAPDNSRTTDHN